MENGAALLSSAFGSVVRVDCPPNYLVVTDCDAVADYVSSVADHYEIQVELPWAEVVDRVRDLARATVARDGELRFSAGGGAFICR